ncbi:MAG: response regulator transcription factor [Oscillospiraceae bacterium]|nr:response regulator transcription factor [Oscillospiraceae bacterium]
MKRILVVDGDMAVRAQIGRHARLEGYDVAEASDGYTAVALCRQSAFDFVILAVMLPEMDGFTVCQTIRSFSQVPILILSERGDEADRIRGLELGADDYVVKPFSPRELMLRISAIMKRGPLLDSMRQRSIEQDGIYIDLIARRVLVDGNQVSLTPKEFDVLALLAANPDVVFSRKKILDTVWGGDLPEDTRTLDTHIKQVRRAIMPYNDRIVTLRGIGYRFEKQS